MSQPDREAELFSASEEFWNKETASMRESILIAAGYHSTLALNLKYNEFRSLNSWAQRAVVRQIGGILAGGGAI